MTVVNNNIPWGTHSIFCFGLSNFANYHFQKCAVGIEAPYDCNESFKDLDSLVSDPFYASHSFGELHSYIYPFKHVGENESCIELEGKPQKFSVETDNEVKYITYLLRDENNKIRGPKAGTVCEENIEEPLNDEGDWDKEKLCSFLKELNGNFTSNKVSGSLVSKLVPILFEKYSKDFDEESYISENQTIYNSLKQDERSPKDWTRRMGIGETCASKACSDGHFKDRFTGEFMRINDDHFKAERSIEVARRILDKDCEGL